MEIIVYGTYISTCRHRTLVTALTTSHGAAVGYF